MPNSTAQVIARLESEIAEYRQELRACPLSDRAQISQLRSAIENANEKLSRYLAIFKVRNYRDRSHETNAGTDHETQ